MCSGESTPVASLPLYSRDLHCKLEGCHLASSRWTLPGCESCHNQEQKRSLECNGLSNFQTSRQIACLEARERRTTWDRQQQCQIRNDQSTTVSNLIGTCLRDALCNFQLTFYNHPSSIYPTFRFGGLNPFPASAGSVDMNRNAPNHWKEVD